MSYRSSNSPDLPVPIRIVHKNKRVAFAYSNEAAGFATSGSDEGKASPTYQDAEKLLGDGFKASFILDIQTLLPLIDSAAASDSDYQRIKPYLQKLKILTSSAKYENKTYKTCMVLSLR